MPMNNFLFNVLIHGTSYSENGKKISINKGRLRGRNTVLFFHLDDNNSIIKQRSNLGENICDVLIYISYDTNNGNNKNNANDTKLLILAELKGGNIEHAVEQIKQTYEKLKNMLSRYLRNHNIIWVAVITSTGSSPRNTGEIRRELKRMGIREPLLKTGTKKVDITEDILKILCKI